MSDLKLFDDRKPAEDNHKLVKVKFGHTRKLIDYSEQKKTRPEKIEEIKEVWESPIFKNNNARLTYLFTHCKSPEHGYTIREFAEAIFPEKKREKLIDISDGHIFELLHQMFNRFRKSEIRREIVLAAPYRRYEGEKFGKWYYWNIIDDEQAIKDLRLFTAQCVLGGERVIQELQDFAEHPEDVKAAHDKHRKEIEALIKQGEREEELKEKQARERWIDEHKIGRGKTSQDLNQSKLE